MLAGVVPRRGGLRRVETPARGARKKGREKGGSHRGPIHVHDLRICLANFVDRRVRGRQVEAYVLRVAARHLIPMTLKVDVRTLRRIDASDPLVVGSRDNRHKTRTRIRVLRTV